jgi:hypothetical protein
MTALNVDVKCCSKCGLNKSFEDYWKDPLGKHGLKSSCKVCLRSRKAEHNSQNKERVKSRNAEYRKTNRQPIKQAKKLYRIANKDRIGEYQVQYRAKNRDKTIASNAKRRSERLNALASWADLTKIRMFYQHAQEMQRSTGNRYAVDHIVPLKHPFVCGLHVESNLRVIGFSENSVKGNQFIPYSEDANGHLTYYFPQIARNTCCKTTSQIPRPIPGTSPVLTN